MGLFLIYVCIGISIPGTIMYSEYYLIQMGITLTINIISLLISGFLIDRNNSKVLK